MLTKNPSRSRPTFTDQEALLFHSQGRPGKLEVIATKPMATQRDLSLAYSPGVAVPVLAIAEDESRAYDYTVKGNFVAVITNGTAILGLGNRGALAAKPVMEGKAVLFKRFADIDSIDLEVNTEDPDEFINCVKFLGKGWGGINLEDIKAPECFIIEQRLRELLDIPVFHDDQHGTAIIATAGLLNALDLTGRKIETTKIVCNGAGAAGIARAVANNLGGFDFAAGQVERVQEASGRDDRGAVLVVVKHRNVEQFAQALLDDEALGCFDVFQIDAAPALAEKFHAIDEFVRILGVDLKIDRVDVGEALEQHGLAFHHGLRRERA